MGSAADNFKKALLLVWLMVCQTAEEVWSEFQWAAKEAVRDFFSPLYGNYWKYPPKKREERSVTHPEYPDW